MWKLSTINIVCRLTTCTVYSNKKINTGCLWIVHYRGITLYNLVINKMSKKGLVFS